MAETTGATKVGREQTANTCLLRLRMIDRQSLAMFGEYLLQLSQRRSGFSRHRHILKRVVDRAVELMQAERRNVRGKICGCTSPDRRQLTALRTACANHVDHVRL